LTGTNVAAGQNLRIPPVGVNGIVYTVAAGDTPDTLAQKFTADKDLIVSVNDAEVSGLKPGEVILIPNGVVQAVAAPRSSYTGYAWGGATPIYSANGYDYGWCTWWAANRRAQIGHPVPSNLGNAISWYYIARNMGMPVGSTPQAGAVLWDATIGGLGHVAFVESMNPDGSILVSDMNYPIWGKATYRTVPPGEFGRYKFIY
jgi:surface antigen